MTANRRPHDEIEDHPPPHLHGARLSGRAHRDPPPPADEPGGDGLLIAGIAMAILWVGGAAAFLAGYFGVDQVLALEPAQLLGLGAAVVVPALALIVIGGAAKAVARFATTAAQLEWAARRLASPAERAGDEATRLADAILDQIDRLNRAAEGSLARLGAMEEVLRHHAESVNAASGDAKKEIDDIIETLRRERAAITALSDSLTTEARKISETIDRQAEMVASSADIAASHANEGKQLLDRSAERLSAAASSAQQSGEKAAFAISEQLRDMEALVKVLDDRASALDRVAVAHEANLKAAQEIAQELSMAADTGSAAMRDAVDAALQQARSLAQSVESETREAAQRGMAELEKMRQASTAARLSAAGRLTDASASDDAAPALRRLAEAEETGGAKTAGNGADPEGLRWKDVLANMDETPAGARDADIVVTALKVAGVDVNKALGRDMTARVARARRRAGGGEARALVIDGALDHVRRTAAALAADPKLRQAADAFMRDHARQVTSAVDQNDPARLARLIDSETGRAFLLVDAALADA